MARPRQFRREDIVQAAFNVVRREGREALSARAIARELQSSTMPIYSWMTDMDEIEEEVACRTLDLIIAHETARVTGDAAVDFALGHLTFAEEEPALYRTVYLSHDESQRERKRRLGRVAGERLRKVFSQDPRYADVPAQELQAMLERLMVLAHGYANLHAAGLLEQVDRQELSRIAARIAEESL